MTAAVVMPGHIGTGIYSNTVLAHGEESAPKTTERSAKFRNEAPTTADEVATIILDGIREGRWRILVGEDAHVTDMAVRANPEDAYDVDFISRPGEHTTGLAGVSKR